MVDIQTGKSQGWLAETKFQPHILREDIIPRRDLLEVLQFLVASHRLTLVSAPAGYGKSTLLATLSTSSDIPITWLSLDEDENDPVRFLNAVIFALQRLSPDCGAAAQSLLSNPEHHGNEMRRVTTVLINDVLETLFDPFALVLDDLHRINEPAIFTMLDYLLENLPPQMHLVVSTRVDPALALSRLRARGELAEVRLSELRFDDEEASTFLNVQLGLGLSEEDLALLQSKTEGWAVGLRLIASSLKRLTTAENRRTYIQNLAQTNRNIFDFLAEEVFNHQEEDVKTFLLETAILPELTPELCRAVTKNSSASSILEELYRRNLFLIQIPPFKGQENLISYLPHKQEPILNHQNPTYGSRYRYHDLFAEFLNHKLEQVFPERVPDLHLRAARAENNPVRAVSHYLAAARWLEAADLIEQVAAEMFNRGYLKTLNRWIKALPASFRESRPHLLHYLSHCAFMKGSWEEARMLLEHALLAFESAGDEAGQGAVLADLAICDSALGDLEQSSEFYHRALSFPIPSHTRVQALLGRALARGALGDLEQHEKDFNAAMKIIWQREELDPLYLATFPFFHPEFAFLPGGLEHLERICQQAQALLEDELSPSRLMVEELSTVLHLYQGQLSQAILIGENALALRKRLGGHPYLDLNAAMFLMIAHAARGDYPAVEPLFNVLFLGNDPISHPTPDLPIYLFYAGRVRWLQGCVNEAREIYNQICTLLKNNPHWEGPENRICRVWMKALLEIADRNYQVAEQTLRQPDVIEQKDSSTTVHGSTRLMLARLFWLQNRTQDALAELKSVLAYHEQLGIPFAILVEGQSIVPLLQLAINQGVYKGYASRLLEMLAGRDGIHPVEIPNTEQTLTPREVEVLQQITQGATNRAIAERLVITESTVKTHISHIFLKLDVSNRTEAAARIRELSLL